MLPSYLLNLQKKAKQNTIEFLIYFNKTEVTVCNLN